MAKEQVLLNELLLSSMKRSQKEILKLILEWLNLQFVMNYQTCIFQSSICQKTL